MLVFFIYLSLKEFQARYLVLLLLYQKPTALSDSGSLHKNIQLMQEFLKGPFLVLNFSYYRLMTFLMMSFVIFLSMLMILLSTLNVIKHLICDN